MFEGHICSAQIHARGGNCKPSSLEHHILDKMLKSFFYLLKINPEFNVDL
jgi:hypothetical protein